MKPKITVDGIEYYREQPELTKAKQVLEKWDWITNFIINDLENAKAFYDNMKDEGLTVSMIESEGYLRCIKTLRNEIDEINECIDHE